MDTQTIHNYGDGTWGNYTYSFVYDNMNRLTDASSTIAANTENYVYNGDGRFESKNRSGNNIAYNYTNADNKIENVTVNGSNYSFAYDTKGNVTSDGLNNALLGNYSFRNLPTTMNNFHYTYNDGGERIRKQNVDSVQTDYYLRDYLGRELVIYNYETNDAKEVNIFGNGLIGKIELTDSTIDRYYYLKDHLGSVRSVVDNNSSVVSAQDYYPYGETIRQFNNTRYMLTEKERDTESSNDYFGARYYNNKLGVWLQVDPLSEKYPGVSPYAYTLNNPMRFIDLYGMQSEEIEGDEKTKLHQLPEIVVTAKRPQEPYELRMLYDLYLRNSNKDESRIDATPYIGFGVDYLQHRVSNKMDEVIGRKKFKTTKAKTAAKYSRYLRPLKIISTGLVGYSVFSSVAEGIETGDYSQMFIDLGIEGITIVSGPVGLGLTVLDQTVGLKNMWHAGVKMEIDRARKGLPSPMNYLP